MSIKLVLLFLFVIATAVIATFEVRLKSGQRFNLNIEPEETLATLREKLQGFYYLSSHSWSFLNAKNKTISLEAEEDIPVDQRKNYIFVDIKSSTVKVCLNNDMSRCTDLSISNKITLTNLRHTLISHGFIPDSVCDDWRFVEPKANWTVNGDQISVKQVFIKERTVESDLLVDNFMVENNYIPLINFNNVNLENVYILKGMISHKITINPGVTLNWLRLVLSGKMNCPNAIWKGTKYAIFNGDNEQEEWRVIHHNIQPNVDRRLNDVDNRINADFVLSHGHEAKSIVSSMVFIGAEDRKYIDYTNMKAKAVDLVGQRSKEFKHAHLYSISMFEKYPKDVQFSPIMLSSIRSVHDPIRVYNNVVIAENGTAVVIKIEHVNDRKMFIQIKWNDERITWGMGNYFNDFGQTHEDIVLANNVIMSEVGDARRQLRAFTIGIKPLKSYTNSKGRYEWNDRLRRNIRQNVGVSRPYNVPQAFHGSTLAKGPKNVTFEYRSNYWDDYYDEETFFSFYILNFVNHTVAENVLALGVF